MNLTGKTVFITGASSGIGLACAHRFAGQGADMILAARRTDRLSSLAAELTERWGVKIHVGAFDVRDRAAVELFIAELPAPFANIAILVNNAGLARGYAPVQDGEPDDWEEMIDTNIKGLLYVTRAVVKGMIARDCGHIINIGSIAGHQIYPNGNVYCATKWAVNALTQSLAIDLINSRIKVSTVDPGMVDTEFSLVRFHGDKQRADATYTGLKPLTADDIADSVLFIATRPEYVNIREIILTTTDQRSVNHVKRRV